MRALQLYLTDTKETKLLSILLPVTGQELVTSLMDNCAEIIDPKMFEYSENNSARWIGVDWNEELGGYVCTLETYNKIERLARNKLAEILKIMKTQ